MKPILLKNLIDENLRDSPFDPSILKKWGETIKKKCPHAVYHFLTKTSDSYHYPEKFFYRGLGTTSKELIYHAPFKKIRSSKESSNLSMFFTSEWPAWQKLNIPPRNRSISMSSQYSGAKGYGAAYLVFPTGNPYVGFGTNRDNYYNFSEGCKAVFGTDDFSTEDLDTFISIFLRIGLDGSDAKKYASMLHSKNPSDIFKVIDFIDDFVKNIDPDDRSIIMNYKSQHYQDINNHLNFYNSLMETGSLTKLLETYFDPEKNNIRAKKLSELIVDFPSDPQSGNLRGMPIEMWVSEPCFLIHETIIPQMRRFLK